MSRLTATSEKVSKEVVERVKEIEAELLKEAEEELSTLKEKAKEKKIKEIGIQATLKAVHTLVEEGHKVVADLGVITSRDKKERTNPTRKIKKTSGTVIDIPASVTPAKTVVAIEKPAQITK